MNSILPPSTLPLVSVEDRGPERVQLRIKQLSWSTATVAVTAWICTFGIIPAVLAIAVAKHVLVAILVMGVGLDDRRRRD